MSPENSEDVSGLSYEAALAQLYALIHKLEGGSIPLDEAIAAYEQATRLARHCEELLDRTERRVTALVVGGDGRTSERALDIEPGGGADAAAGVDQGAADPAAAVAPGLFAAERPRARAVDPGDVPF